MSTISLEPEIEKKLIEKSRKDKNNFASLYRHYKKYIHEFFSYRVTEETTAEELTSTVFEKALISLDNFQWQGVSFSAWLYKIARNTLIDHYRDTEKRKKESPLDETYELPSNEKPLHEQVETMFAEDLLYEILSQLNDREREIIYMKFFDGYTNKLIAQLTGLSETNVGTIIYRTIRKLRKIYQENE